MLEHRGALWHRFLYIFCIIFLVSQCNFSADFLLWLYFVYHSWLTSSTKCFSNHCECVNLYILTIWDMNGTHICSQVCTLYIPWNSLHYYLVVILPSVAGLDTYSCLWFCFIIVWFQLYFLGPLHEASWAAFGAP